MMGKRLVVIMSWLVLCLALSISVVASNFNVIIRPFGAISLGDMSLPVELGIPITDDLELTVGTTWVFSTYKDIYPSNPDNDTTRKYKTTIFTIGGRYYYPLVTDLDTYLLGQVGFGKFQSTFSENSIRAYVLGLGAGYKISPHWAIVGELGVVRSVSKDDSEIPIEENYDSTIGSSVALKYSF